MTSYRLQHRYPVKKIPALRREQTWVVALPTGISLYYYWTNKGWMHQPWHPVKGLGTLYHHPYSHLKLADFEKLMSSKKAERVENE